MNLNVETLESRDTPVAFVGVQGDVLAVVLVGPGSHAAVVSSATPGGPVSVVADFQSWMVTVPVSQVIVAGASDAPNVVLDTTDIPVVMAGGNKADVLFAPQAKAAILTGGGADIVVATVGSFVVSDPADLVVYVPVPLPVIQPAIRATDPTTAATPSGTAAPAPTFGAPSFSSLFGGLTP